MNNEKRRFNESRLFMSKTTHKFRNEKDIGTTLLN